MTTNNPCTICGQPGVPGLIAGQGKCQYHWNVGAFGKLWADHCEDRKREPPMSDDDKWVQVNKGLHDRCLACAQRWKLEMSGSDYRLLSEVASAWAACMEVPQSKIDSAKAILTRFKL